MEDLRFFLSFWKESASFRCTSCLAACGIIDCGLQVRALIVATRLYTGRAVDVIAFSLGVPVSRKAILGGEHQPGHLFQYCEIFKYQRRTLA